MKNATLSHVVGARPHTGLFQQSEVCGTKNHTTLEIIDQNVFFVTNFILIAEHCIREKTIGVLYPRSTRNSAIFWYYYRHKNTTPHR